MCTYITATLNAGSDSAQVHALAMHHGLGWQALFNRKLVSQVAPGSKWFLTSRKYCDCGTALGSAGKRPERTHDSASDVPKLKKRGWSDAKISRWLADKSAAEARQLEYQTRGTGLTREVDNWITFLTSAIASKAADHVGVLIHEYSGGVSGERIAIKRREVIRVSEVTPELLWKMEFDVLYQFGR